MKIHPQQIIAQIIPRQIITRQLCNYTTTTTTSNNVTYASNKETFTLWMKSLVLGGKGCTVFDTCGNVVYRVDNYRSKYSNKVFLMDCHGHVLLTIFRKKYRLFSRWDGYRDEKIKGSSWLFRVQKSWKMTKMTLGSEVVVNLDHDKKSPGLKIEKGKNGLSSCKIVDRLRGPIAEMKRKQSEGGGVLGDDVLTLVVEANVDPSLIMGLMVAFSLIHSRI